MPTCTTFTWFKTRKPHHSKIIELWISHAGYELSSRSLSMDITTGAIHKRCLGAHTYYHVPDDIAPGFKLALYPDKVEQQDWVDVVSDNMQGEDSALLGAAFNIEPDPIHGHTLHLDLYDMSGINWSTKMLGHDNVINSEYFEAILMTINGTEEIELFADVLSEMSDRLKQQLTQMK